MSAYSFSVCVGLLCLVGAAQAGQGAELASGAKPPSGTPKQLEDCLVDRTDPLVTSSELSEIVRAMRSVIGSCPQPADETLDGHQAVRNAIVRLQQVKKGAPRVDQASGPQQRFRCDLGGTVYLISVTSGPSVTMSKNGSPITVRAPEYTQDEAVAPSYLQFRVEEERFQLHSPDPEGDGRHGLVRLLPGYYDPQTGTVRPDRRDAGLCDKI